MTPSDHTTAAALDRISQAMDVAELCEHQNRMTHQPPGNTAPRFVAALCIKRTNRQASVGV